MSVATDETIEIYIKLKSIYTIFTQIVLQENDDDMYIIFGDSSFMDYSLCYLLYTSFLVFLNSILYIFIIHDLYL